MIQNYIDYCFDRELIRLATDLKAYIRFLPRNKLLYINTNKDISIRIGSYL
jgi:hypothetical protein